MLKGVRGTKTRHLRKRIQIELFKECEYMYNESKL